MSHFYFQINNKSVQISIQATRRNNNSPANQKKRAVELNRRWFLLSLHCMKLVVLILSFLLSFLSGGRTEVVNTSSQDNGRYSVSESQSTEKTADYTQNRELCITAAQGYTFAGGGNSNSVSIRVTQSGKRTSPQVRSTFRIIKGGKIIDNNHLHPFLAQSIVHQAGMYISDRYLFSICSLRL